MPCKLIWKASGRQKAEIIKWNKGPVEKLHSHFRILQFPPSNIHRCWIYSTLGMSLEREDEYLIELHLFSDVQDNNLVELLEAVLKPN